MAGDDELVDVAFCCNDHRGNAQGFVERIEIRTKDGHELELDSTLLDGGPVFRTVRLATGLGVMVGRRAFRIRSYRHHVGNWCWDSATMTRERTGALVAHVLREGFTVTCWTEGNDLLPEGFRG